MKKKKPELFTFKNSCVIIIDGDQVIWAHRYGSPITVEKEESQSEEAKKEEPKEDLED